MADDTTYTVVDAVNTTAGTGSNSFYEKNVTELNTPPTSPDTTAYTVVDSVDATATGSGNGSFYEKNTLYEALIYSQDSIDAVTAQANAAAASRAAADADAAAALASQNAAASSASSASSSASAAAASATAAAGSATTATTEAGIATTQAGNAATSAAAASASATSASGSAATATTQAGNASSSATAAATSATNAASSATAAAASAAAAASGSATPLMDGVAAVGTSTHGSHEDHVHPTDTSRAPLASPTFTGTPAAPTPTAGDNTTKLATTAFVTGAIAPLVGALVYQGTWNASTNSPALTSSVGTKGFLYKVSVAGSTAIDGNSQWNVGDSIVFDGTTWDKIDGIATEVTSVAGRVGAVTLAVADVSGAAPLASPGFSGTPTAPTAAVDTNTTQLASTAFVLAQAASATPLIDGSAAVGTSTRFAREDHVHPTDTTRAPLASPTFTGTPAGPTATVGTNTTQLATTAFVLANSAAGGVTSIAGNTGAFTLSNGLTNSTNDLRLANVNAGSVLGVSGASAAIPTSVRVPVLLATLTANNTATSLSDTTSLTSTYGSYEIVFSNLVVATLGASLLLQIHSGGAFKTTGYFSIAAMTGGVAGFTNTITTGIPLTYNAATDTTFNPKNATPGLNGTLRIYNPAVSNVCLVNGQVGYLRGDATGSMSALTSGFWNTAGVIDGFQVVTSAGNLLSGTIKIYGIP